MSAAFPTPPAWVAADWGTSQLRLWLMDGADRAIEERRAPCGKGSLAPSGFEPALVDLLGDALPATGRLTVICCGMAGSRRGWAEAPYATAPCAPPSAAEAVKAPTADPRLAVWLLPGIRQDSPPDVMRGEETQIAGLLAAEPGFDGVVCLPGTHTKWVHLSAGEVVSFRSFLTGELFALLRDHSVLRHAMVGEGRDDDAFDAAVADALSRPAEVAGKLFEIRAASLLQGLSPASARARLSGLLIGIELAAARPYWLGQDLRLLGEAGIARAYAAALDAQGAPARCLDADAMTRAGLTAALHALGEGVTS
jgi:2-dehydro-3-deoxygalactonokinase